MFSVRVTEESTKRELAEWFKAASLRLVKGNTFICSNHILSDTYIKGKKKIYKLTG